MKKLFALLISVVMLVGILASFSNASYEGSEDYDYEGSDSNYEGSNEENSNEVNTNDNNMMNITKRVVDGVGYPYTADPNKTFSVTVTMGTDYSRTFDIKAGETIPLDGLEPGTYLIQEAGTSNYTRIDGNMQVIIAPLTDERFFPDRAVATLGMKSDNTPVEAGRANSAAALVDEPNDVLYQDGNFLSLGYDGVAVFEFDTPFYNGAGDEVGVSEISWPLDSSEMASVEASKTGAEGTYYPLGYIYNDSTYCDADGEFYTFDLGELDWAKFIRITDRSTSNFFVSSISSTSGEAVTYEDPFDGIDIDYVCVRYIDRVYNTEVVNQYNPPAVNPPPVVPAPAAEYFTLTTSVIGQGAILPGPGATSYAKGTKVQLNPTPAEGWQFDSWQGNTVDSENQIYIDSNMAITAVFSQKAVVEPVAAEIETRQPTDEASPETEIIEEEQAPAALPVTGGIPALAFYGIGGIAALSGLVMRRRQK